MLGMITILYVERFIMEQLNWGRLYESLSLKKQLIALEKIEENIDYDTLEKLIEDMLDNKYRRKNYCYCIREKRANL